MLPANPFGVTYRRAFSLIRSLPIRSSGRPSFHCRSPCLRYDTVTEALRLSSPSMCHSKPSERSVGGSVTNSPAVVRSAARNGAAQSSAMTPSATARIGGGLAGGERLGDRRAERRIFRRHRAREERDDAALFVDEVFAEVPGRQVARLAEEAVDRGLVRAFPSDHLLEHRECHVIGDRKSTR